MLSRQIFCLGSFLWLIPGFSHSSLATINPSNETHPLALPSQIIAQNNYSQLSDDVMLIADTDNLNDEQSVPASSNESHLSDQEPEFCRPLPATFELPRSTSCLDSLFQRHRPRRFASYEPPADSPRISGPTTTAGATGGRR